MKQKTKTILKLMAATIGIVAIIVLGGIWERGYYWPAAEVFVGPGIIIGYITWRMDRKERT